MPAVVFLNRFYWPDVAATGQQLTDLAEDLAAGGWEVTVVTGRGAYAGGTTPLPPREERRGVRIVRVPATRFGRGGAPGRVADYLSYLASALVALLRDRRPDVVVAMSDPPLLVAVALLAARLRGARTVYWVQDLFPQLAARLGVMREDGLPYRALDALTRRLHRRCDAVIALGPRMARAAVAAGARPERTSFVRGWADAGAVHPVPAEGNPMLGEHGLNGEFVVLYSGNAGRAHTFDAVRRAMQELRDDPGIVFVFIGGGIGLMEVRATVEREGLRNVRFLDYLPRPQLALSLSMASLALVTEDPRAAGLLVPSKVYGVLASGRPVLFVGSEDSDAAEVVREAGCGFVVAPHDPAGVVRVIRELRADPDAAARLGRRAREAAQARYDRRLATARWRELVGGLVGG